jgi:hypothetical protein
MFKYLHKFSLLLFVFANSLPFIYGDCFSGVIKQSDDCCNNIFNNHFNVSDAITAIDQNAFKN